MQLVCVERLIVVILYFVFFFDIKLNVVALLRVIKIIVVLFVLVALTT